MATTRRVGAETSKTRDVLLDGVERLLLESGYASVTYRAVAAKAAVTSWLVQYYFPKLDDVIEATIRRRSDQNLARLTAALEAQPDRPLHVVWSFSREEATAALMTEFTALGNHRPSIGAVIAEVTEAVRSVELAALEERWGAEGPPGFELSMAALQFLLAGIPKLVTLEASLGIAAAHAEVLDGLERLIDQLEPLDGEVEPGS